VRAPNTHVISLDLRFLEDVRRADGPSVILAYRSDLPVGEPRKYLTDQFNVEPSFLDALIELFESYGYDGAASRIQVHRRVFKRSVEKQRAAAIKAASDAENAAERW